MPRMLVTPTAKLVVEREGRRNRRVDHLPNLIERIRGLRRIDRSAALLRRESLTDAETFVAVERITALRLKVLPLERLLAHDVTYRSRLRCSRNARSCRWYSSSPGAWRAV